MVPSEEVKESIRAKVKATLAAGKKLLVVGYDDEKIRDALGEERVLYRTPRELLGRGVPESAGMVFFTHMGNREHKVGMSLHKRSRNDVVFVDHITKQNRVISYCREALGRPLVITMQEALPAGLRHGSEKGIGAMQGEGNVMDVEYHGSSPEEKVVEAAISGAGPPVTEGVATGSESTLPSEAAPEAAAPEKQISAAEFVRQRVDMSVRARDEVRRLADLASRKGLAFSESTIRAQFFKVKRERRGPQTLSAETKKGRGKSSVTIVRECIVQLRPVMEALLTAAEELATENQLQAEEIVRLKVQEQRYVAARRALELP